MKYEIPKIDFHETHICTAVLYGDFLCSVWAKDSGEYGYKFVYIL